MHTQTTSTPILSSNSRDLSYNARHLSYERTCPAGVSPILQISRILQILIQTVHSFLSSISRDLSYNARHLSYERTCPAEVFPILQIPTILQILIQTNHPILSSNARDLSQNTHTSTRLFATPLPSRKSPRIPQILLQTTKQNRSPSTPHRQPSCPSLISNTAYKRSYYPLSPIHYPLPFPPLSSPHNPAIFISPQPCYLAIPTLSTAARSGTSGGRKWRN